MPDAARSYFEALATEDLAHMGTMLDVSAEGSPAALYATHQIAFTRGLGDLPNPAQVGGSDRTITLTSIGLDNNGNESTQTTTYSDFTMEGDRLTGFAVDDVPVADRVRAGQPASADGITVRVVTAYHTARGDLALNVDITNGREGVLEVADYEWNLVTPDGRQVGPSESLCCPMAPTVQPGATAGHIVVFEQVGLGGTLRFVGFADDFMTEVRFDVPVPA